MTTRSSSSLCESEYYDSPYPQKERWPKCRDRFVSTTKDFNIPYAEVLATARVHYEHIAIDADVICGTPRIAGTRIPVYMVLDAVQHYGTLEGALLSYPHLSIEQVKDALRFSVEVLEHPVEYKSEAIA